MIDIDGKYYMLDLDMLMAWVVETPASEKNINTITTMSYPITNEDDNELVEKEVSETKSTLNEVMNNVRYDLIRNLLNILFTTFTNDMGQIVILSMNDLTLAQKIVFNTLLNKKIIIEISKTENE
jgi:hypothetical protein